MYMCSCRAKARHATYTRPLGSIKEMKKAQIGKTLIIIGLIISLNPYLIIFIGGPIFIIGSIIHWTTKKTKKSKSMWTLIPIIIWYPLMISFFWITGIIGKSTAQKRDYIIPEDFKGTIKIVESKCGETPIIKKGRIQFNIPQNGIYLFNGELKSGYINERHYIQKKNGELVELKSKYFANMGGRKDTTGIEKIIKISEISYGSFGDDKSNFIGREVKTNKVYDDNDKWKMNKEQNEILDSLRKDCKIKNKN